jgi:Zn-dependent M28 family amino/carboxypeptidase
LRHHRRALGALLAVAVCAAITATPASAATQTDTKAFEDAVSVGTDTSGIRQHLRRFQQIADANANTRATGTAGHRQSADYVISKLDPNYWRVTTQPFIADVFSDLAPPTLSASPAASPAWVADADFATMEFSVSGSVSGAHFDVFGYVPPTRQESANTSGCEDTDFPAGATSLAGKVAVLQRGTCPFADKARNAQAHGAVAVVIFNEGTIGAEDRIGLVNGTLDPNNGINIPVLGTTYAVGLYLVQHPAATISLSASTLNEKKPTYNVIAETKTGRTDRTVLSGAHLDSVPEGPGINDDGSGSATQLELARQMAAKNFVPRNQVRFVWFSGEEQGLLGSIFYADSLSKAQRASVLAMLDFDMLASPNYALQIYDGDGSEFGTAGPNGSGVVEKVFQDFFNARGLYTERIEFDGRSDYDEFTVLGIPAGGIATGAEVHKTPFEQSKWGGTVSDSLAGQFDPCYHLACDSYGINGHPDNINNYALGVMSDAVVNAVIVFAQTTSATNGTGKASGTSVKAYDWKGDKLVK